MERRQDFLFAYALTLSACAAAATYGLLSAAAPVGYLKAVGAALSIFVVCHLGTWFANKRHRPFLLRIFFLSCIAASGLALALSARGGTDAADLSARAARAEAEKRAQWELARIEAQRAGLPAFRPVSAKGLAVLESDVQSLENRRAEECGRRGPLCQSFREAEDAKRAALASVLAEKAIADEAAKLDRMATAVRTELAVSPPPPPSAFAQLTGWSTAESMANYVLLITAMFALGGGCAVLLAYTRDPKDDPVAARPQRAAWLSMALYESKSSAEARPTGYGTSRNLPLHDERKSAHIDGRLGIGDVSAFLQDCIQPAEGKAARVSDIFSRYRDWCRAQVPPRPPIRATEFVNVFKLICDDHGSKIGRFGSRFYLKDMELKP